MHVPSLKQLLPRIAILYISREQEEAIRDKLLFNDIID